MQAESTCDSNACAAPDACAGGIYADAEGLAPDPELPSRPVWNNQGLHRPLERDSSIGNSMEIGLDGHDRTDLAASPRLFENPLLDRLSRVHHLVPPLFYLPIFAALLWLAAKSLTLPIIVVCIVGGYLTWTLVEYFGHRFLFHYRARSPIGRRILFLVHGVHHDHPSDPLRLVMPLLMSVPIMAAACAVLGLVCGAELGRAVSAGFIAGYVGYDMLHFHVHHGRPRTAFGRFLRFRHMHHHFRDETSWFGVSAPWWDAVFATRAAGVGRRTPSGANH